MVICRYLASFVAGVRPVPVLTSPRRKNIFPAAGFPGRKFLGTWRGSLRYRPGTLIAVVATVGLLGALPQAGSRQPTTQPAGPVAREVRELRQSVERGAEQSARVALAVQRASTVQARLSAVGREFADVRSQPARVSAGGGTQYGRRERL